MITPVRYDQSLLAEVCHLLGYDPKVVLAINVEPHQITVDLIDQRDRRRHIRHVHPVDVGE